jgi:hypothetical protein
MESGRRRFFVLGAWCLVLGWVVLALISVYPRERGTRIGLGLLETASLRSPPSGLGPPAPTSPTAFQTFQPGNSNESHDPTDLRPNYF